MVREYNFSVKDLKDRELGVRMSYKGGLCSWCAEVI